MNRRRRTAAVTATTEMRRAVASRSRIAVLCTAILLGAAVPVWAHDPGLSALDLRVSGRDLFVTLSLAPADARALETTTGETLAAAARQSIELRVDGTALDSTVAESAVEGDTGERVVLRFARPREGSVTIHSGVPGRLARGHRQLLSVRDDRGSIVSEWMLGAGNAVVTVDLTALGTGRSTARQFGGLGLTHILGGYDHLLFVCALLLGVRRIGTALKTITAFTVAHSITLAAAALRIAHAPAAIVEPLIAASIVYVAVENLMRKDAGARWPLTFAFGLVHGFGFAGAIQDLGLEPGAEIVAPLFWFNAGVEAGQIAVVTALWPLVLLLTTPQARRWSLAHACSILIGAAGCYWLLERTLGS